MYDVHCEFVCYMYCVMCVMYIMCVMCDDVYCV